MKILGEAEPGNRAMGRCWLDPRNLPLMLEGTKSRVSVDGNGVAGIVLVGRHLVASTISCNDHVSMAMSAGLDLKDTNPFYGSKIEDFRGFAIKNAITIEIWRPDDEKHPDSAIEDDVTTPLVDTEILDNIISAVRAHPGVKIAFPGGVPEVTVSVLCSLGRAEWIYRESDRRLQPASTVFGPQEDLDAAPSPQP